MKIVEVAVFVVLSSASLWAQAPKSTAGADPLSSLGFLEGTWDANVQSNAAIQLCRTIHVRPRAERSRPCATCYERPRMQSPNELRSFAQ